MGRHRLERIRTRYGRMLSASCALAVTLVAVVGGLGGTPTPRGAAPMPVANAGLALPDGIAPVTNAVDATERTATNGTESLNDATVSADEQGGGTTSGGAPREEVVDPAPAKALPADSGEGRRVVFSESAQRVWLVTEGDEVQRTYLVSGSAYDNLDPGTYSVYSRSENAVGIDDSGTMQYFVRFTRGENAAIGFHDIPVLEGDHVQTLEELGTPLSHGCIRQRREDAIALWEFAPLGTTVVVVP